MDIDMQISDGVAVLLLQGRFDAHETGGVAAAIEQVSASAPARLVVDLQAVTFIDSTALGVLVQGMKRCRQAEGDLRLCGLNQTVKIIFELTRLDRAFVLFTDVAAARQAPW